MFILYSYHTDIMLIELTIITCSTDDSFVLDIYFIHYLQSFFIKRVSELFQLTV